jgi:hypothetical protein
MSSDSDSNSSGRALAYQGKRDSDGSITASSSRWSSNLSKRSNQAAIGEAREEGIAGEGESARDGQVIVGEVETIAEAGLEGEEGDGCRGKDMKTAMASSMGWQPAERNPDDKGSCFDGQGFPLDTKALSSRRLVGC